MRFQESGKVRLEEVEESGGPLTTFPSNSTTRTQCRPRPRRRRTFAAALRSFGLSEEVDSTRKLRSSDPISASVRLPSAAVEECPGSDEGEAARANVIFHSPCKDASSENEHDAQTELPPEDGAVRRVLWLDRLLRHGDCPFRASLERARTGNGLDQFCDGQQGREGGRGGATRKDRHAALQSGVDMLEPSCDGTATQKVI